MTRIFDHIDLRVPNLEEARPFYEGLLPALGFTRPVPIDGWLQFEAPPSDGAPFFGLTESPGHLPNENRIAFRADGREKVDELGEVLRRIGARNIEGPMDYETNYYAVFFEDPFGNRFEVCHRGE